MESEWYHSDIMPFPVRLSPALDLEARAYCERVGCSLNALVGVALDAYLRRPEPAGPGAGGLPPEPPKPATGAVQPPARVKLSKAERKAEKRRRMAGLPV